MNLRVFRGYKIPSRVYPGSASFYDLISKQIKVKVKNNLVTMKNNKNHLYAATILSVLLFSVNIEFLNQQSFNSLLIFYLF